MVNIFGKEEVRGRKGDRGPVGPMGPPGKQGDAGSIEDSCTWMGNTVLKNLEHYDDKGCFFIDDPSTDVKRNKEGEITTWISKSVHGKNLMPDIPSKQLSKKLINDRYALMFDGTARYQNEELGLFQVTSGNCFGFLCMTFRTTSDDKDQVLLSTFQGEDNPYAEVSISGAEKKIVIKSKIDEPVIVSIENDVKQWSTLYVEYRGYESKPTEYNYIVRCGQKKTSGSFLWDSSDMFMFGFSMGSRFNDTRFLKGEISSLEIYHVNETTKPFPECLKNLVIDNHMMKDVNPPSSKKSRVN
jgi:hypothetical protein